MNRLIDLGAPILSRLDEVHEGRAAADALAREWPNVSAAKVTSEGAARAAIARLAEIICEQPALLQASREGSERGAEALSPRPFQGVLESLQNADDLHASELRIAVVERGGRRELLIVHDGDPVQLEHVAAMVLPWVTTKADDPNASGRFGIGQMTLRSLGGPIEVHCAPFHFRMEADAPVPCEAFPDMQGLYSREAGDTLVCVPLLDSVDAEALAAFVAELGPRALVFLGSVRRLSLIDPSSGQRIIDHHLVEVERARLQVELSAPGHIRMQPEQMPDGRIRFVNAESNRLVAERLELRDTATDHRYVRYVAEAPLSADEARSHKARGLTTPIGVAFAVDQVETGLVFDRLPMPVPWTFPFSLNAQFDPDAARQTILQRTWNEHRLVNLGDFLGAAALDCFARDPATSWALVPLASEIAAGTPGWLADALRASIVERAHRRIARDLRLPTTGGPRFLGELVYEEASLDGLLSVADQEVLCEGRFALGGELRDPAGRWRRVLEELARSTLLTTSRAIQILQRSDEQLGERTRGWYVSMARAAVDAGCLEDFLASRSVLLADGTRVEPPAGEDPRVLVRRLTPTSLAAILGIAWPPSSASPGRFTRRTWMRAPRRHAWPRRSSRPGS